MLYRRSGALRQNIPAITSTEGPISGGTWKLAAISGSIYKLCGSPIYAEWIDGIETWDIALGARMEFDEVPCANNADITLNWESEADNCESLGMPNTYACWDPGPTCTIHGAHCDLKTQQAQGNVRILFDAVNYAAPYTGGAYEMPDGVTCSPKTEPL